MKMLQGYIGTYTKKRSLGIYRFSIDAEKESISSVQLAVELENPTYLAIDGEKKMLYSVIKQENFGGIAAFSVDIETGKLFFQGKMLTEGTPPCHISIGKKCSWALSAYYHRGALEAYALNEDGTLQEIVSQAVHKGDRPSHVHYAAFSPDEHYVIAVDLGLDALFTYEIIGERLIETERCFLRRGSGPRHLAFHPNGTIAYCITELSSEIITFSYDAEKGTFKELQSISTLPDDFPGPNQASAIHISSDGKFVYAGNRGHNSIAIFRINGKSGLLSPVDIVHTNGIWPRDFSLDPTGKFLLAANQESNHLALFKRNEQTAELIPLPSAVEVPEPVCVKFLPLE